MVKGKSCQRVPDAQAAAELGVCVQYMHQQMKRGRWDLGEVIPPSKKNGKTNYAYHIYREKLDTHLYGSGKTAKQLEELQKQNLKNDKTGSPGCRACHRADIQRTGKNQHRCRYRKGLHKRACPCGKEDRSAGRITNIWQKKKKGKRFVRTGNHGFSFKKKRWNT